MDANPPNIRLCFNDSTITIYQARRRFSDYGCIRHPCEGLDCLGLVEPPNHVEIVSVIPVPRVGHVNEKSQMREITLAEASTQFCIRQSDLPRDPELALRSAREAE
jgi:hypothetical protein